MDPEFIGAIKVKDGLFLGDLYASQDLEFIVTNKVTHIINTASEQVPNHWEPIGVKYLNFDWDPEETALVITTALAESLGLLQEASRVGGSVLIHSEKGKNRSVCLTAACLMKSYCWGLSKTIDFLTYRKPDLLLSDSYLEQLIELEQAMGNYTTRWTELSDSLHIDSEELLLRNTYINSQPPPPHDTRTAPQHSGVQVRWADSVAQLENSCKNTVEDGLVLLSSCLKHGSRTQLKLPAHSAKQHPLAVLNSLEDKRKWTKSTCWAQRARPSSTGRENLRTPVLAKGGLEERRGENRHKAQSRNRYLTSGLRPPSPLIRSNQAIQNIKRPSWR